MRRRSGRGARRSVLLTPAQVWELPTGHDCMIIMLAELGELLLKLA